MGKWKIYISIKCWSKTEFLLFLRINILLKIMLLQTNFDRIFHVKIKYDPPLILGVIVVLQNSKSVKTTYFYSFSLQVHLTGDSSSPPASTVDITSGPLRDFPPELLDTLSYKN